MAWKEVTMEDGDVWDKSAPIEGVFVKADKDVGPNKSMMYTIETKEGNVKVWGSTVLDDKLVGIPAGTLIKIDYEGKKSSKNGSQYHDYKLFIDEESMPTEEVVEEED